METEATIPKKQGQVCKIINPADDENPGDVYLVAEDPRPFEPEDDIYVVNLKDLQRNLPNPLSAPQIAIAKNGLRVISESLEDYIQSWNNPA